MFFFSLRMIVRSSSWRTGHINFSRRAGDLHSNLVASSKILVAMATKMVATWRVEVTCTNFIMPVSFHLWFLFPSTLTRSHDMVMQRPHSLCHILGPFSSQGYKGLVLPNEWVNNKMIICIINKNDMTSFGLLDIQLASCWQCWCKLSLQMLDMFDVMPFDDIDGGAWKQGWDVRYDDKQFDQEPLNVFVVPHSHNDPGIVCFE